MFPACTRPAAETNAQLNLTKDMTYHVHVPACAKQAAEAHGSTGPNGQISLHSYITYDMLIS